MNKKYKTSIPRQMYWSNAVKNSKICPRCGSSLEKELVLDRENFIRLASVGIESTGYDDSSVELAVAGIVDMDAIHSSRKKRQNSGH